MNEYDSARIADLLTHHGLEEAGSVEDADLIILNTCAVREKAEVKLYHQLGRWKGLKKNNPAKIFAVGGCVASETGKQIRARAPIVDIIFGPQTYHRLPEMIQRLEAGQGPQIDVS
ncbi:MAG: tRNA (N6-isopentenyl adenosine(37)-C2)-methylthiotransferase MiaB, partial [Succinivibrionaceae bacterium]|nr:tRNA (N6-isopentenyl adenosine(37)-C2)-methylthiotransferase MiaB [Succinivibrionaceae bacterium]